MDVRLPTLVSLLAGAGLRLLLVFAVSATCMFLAVSRPALDSLLLAYIGFLGTLAGAWAGNADLVLAAYRHSVLALAVALALGLLLGVPLGLTAGMRPHARLSILVRLTGSLGLTTPSFLLALLIMIFFVLYVLPATGVRFILISGQAEALDPRRLVPIALTLCVRPLAYFTTVTAAASASAVHSDFVRTALGKGLSPRMVLWNHIWPNVLPHLLDAIPPALVFAIGSLPIVEFIFNWPGVGQQILFGVVAPDYPAATRAALVAFLLAGMGATYILAVAAIDILRRSLYPAYRPVDRG